MKIISCDCLKRHCDSLNLAVKNYDLIPEVEQDFDRYFNVVYHLYMVNHKDGKREKKTLVQLGATYCQECGKKIEVENDKI